MQQKVKMGFERQFVTSRNSNIKVVAEIDSRIQDQHFTNAVKKLARKHPLFQTRVEMDEVGNGYFVHDESIYPKTVIISLGGEQKIENVLHEQNSQPSSWSQSPARFILVHGPQNDWILAYIHHSISDGRAVAWVMKHLLEFIADPEKSIQVLEPVFMNESAPDDARIGKFMIKMMGMINKKWAKEKPDKPYPEREFIEIAKEVSHYLDNFLELSFTEEETILLRNKARSEGVSLNSVLLIAALMAKNRIDKYSSYPDKAGFAVDVRNKVKKEAGEACTILASSTSIKANFKKYRDFWEITQDIQKQADKAMKSNKKLFMRRLLASYMDPTFSDAMYLKQVGKRDVGGKFIRKLVDKKRKMPVGVMITNLGGLQIPKSYLGQNHLEVNDAIFYPPVGVPGVIELGIASLRGKIHILIPANEEKFDMKAQTKYLDELKKILLELLT